MASVIKMQVYILFQRKGTWCTYLLMCILIVINYVGNVVQYYGYNIWNMYHSMRLGLLGEYSSWGFYFMQYYPFIVIVPAAFTYFTDKKSRNIMYIETRIGRTSYYIGTFIAVFSTTFFVFTIPLFLEMLLNGIAFPKLAVGEQSNLGLFQEAYTEMIDHYLFKELWLFNPYLYIVVMILLFGGISGILACFAMALSMVKEIKYKALLFVPIYALTYITMSLEYILGLPFSTNYFFYFRFLCVAEINSQAYMTFMCVILVLSFLAVCFKSRRDEFN